jgi:peptide/nickel transport system permease protein
MSNENKYSYSLTRFAWQRLKKNNLAVFGMGFILITAIIAVLGSLIRPDFTEHANDQKLQLAKKKPGFEVMMLRVKKNADIDIPPFWERMFFGGREDQYRSIPIYDYEFSGTDILIEEYTGNNEKYTGKKIPINIADVLYSLDENNRYEEDFSGKVSFYVIDEGKLTESISEMQMQIVKDNIIIKKYWLGTDQFGRDLHSRLMAGALVSLSVGFISVFISLLIGMVLGAVGGFFRGWVDDIIMWIINVVWSIPTLLLVIAITFALGKGFWQIFVAVGLTMWVEVARVVRGQVISIREQEYIEAGRALGFTNFRLISKHVLPNVMGPVIVISAANFASAILIESGLSFLGIGLQPPMASWGRMIKEHYGFIMVDGAYLAILPGVAIMLMVLSFMLVGNGLRDALDTKSMGGSNSNSGNIPNA